MIIVASEKIREGERNVRLAAFVGALIAEHGDDRPTVERMARTWVQENCEPPLRDAEINNTINSIYNTDRRNNGLEPVHRVEHVTPELKGVFVENIFAPAPPVFLKKKKDEPIKPVELPPCPGLVGQLAQSIADGTAASTPDFNLLASIVFVGTAVGGRVMSSSGLRTNLYGISLGYSGSGKNGPLSYLHRVCSESNCMNLIGGSTLGSGASILRSLEKQPKQIIMADEIGDLVKGIKQQGSYSADLPHVLKELWSATDRKYTKNYSDVKKSFTLNWHHLSLYACGVPEPFWDNLSIDDVSDGFLARCLIVENDAPAPLPRIEFDHKIPTKIVNAFARWNTESTPVDGDISRVPIPRVVPFEPSAKAHYDEFALRWHNDRNEVRKDCTGKSAIYGRAGENAIKIALIVECGMGEGLPDFISLEATKWACAYVKARVDYLVSRLSGSLNTNEHDKYVNRLVAFIEKRESSGKRTFKRDLSQGPFRSVLPRMRVQYIGMAKESGRITVEQIGSTRGSGTEEYKLCK